MALTLGITGMDGTQEADVRAAFAAANAASANRWTLVEGDRADVVLIDMDSLYGPMSWLRLHAAGCKVIGLTAREHSQTDYRLPRPVEASALAELLAAIADQAGEAGPARRPPPSTSTPAPAPTDELPPIPAAVPQDATEALPDLAPAMAGSLSDNAPQAPPDRPLTDWLQPGALSARVRYQRDEGPVLLIDPLRREWVGPAALKPVAACFKGTAGREDFAAVDDAEWNREQAAQGPAQPLSRLQWLGALVSGNGALLPGLDPQGRYRLLKWPQTEREYPKHFRIATAMMKGPATVDEVAEASGVPYAEVADFFNANLATGFAEYVPSSPLEPAEPAPRPSGLLDRLRGR